MASHLIVHYKERNPHRNHLINTHVHTHAHSVRADADYSSDSQLVGHIVKIANLDPDGSIWFHLYTVRVKERPGHLEV